MNAPTNPLDQEAELLARLLFRKRLKIVFAESCTGGLIAATLARIPGVSNVLAGSAVVYQEPTKTAWLGISAKLLAKKGAVSAKTARAMVLGALRKTPHAQLAAAVTGHLGPDAPRALDGKVFVAVAVRGRAANAPVFITEWNLLSQSRKLSRKSAIDLRCQRQQLASQSVMFMVRSLLTAADTEGRK